VNNTLILSVLTAAAAFADPKVSGVVNAASNIPLGTAGSGIAQGAFFVIFGTGLGPSPISIAGMPYPAAIGGTNGTSVTITPATGTPVTAWLYYSLETQVAGILPSNTPVGSASVTVTYNGSTSAPAKITVVKSNFGIFTLNQQGSGPAAVLNRNPDGLNSLTNPIADGGVLEVYGTGLGPVAVPDNTPPGAAVPAGVDVKVLVGGQTITPLYAGRAPSFAGEDQIDFQLPADASVPDGCFVPFAIQVNGVVGNYGTFAKATGGQPCPAPLGLSTGTLKKLDAGGSAAIGLLSLDRIAAQASLAGLSLTQVTEAAGGVFSQFDAAGVFGLALTPGAVPPLNSAGTCIVQTQSTVSVPTSTLPAVPKDLSAGAQLTLKGPNGKSKTLPYTTGVGYSAALSSSIGPSTPFIEAGDWMIAGTGGPDVGAFTATLTVPAALTCTNCDQITAIDRTKPLLVTWSGGGGSSDYVQIGGTSSAPSTADPAKNVVVIFSCTARASDGQFTVPVSVLGQVPRGAADILAANTGALVLINVLGNPTTAFTAPLTAGGSLDLGFFGYAGIFFKLVAYN
jgi:uncharacterized protein (TIGR03437 family)